MSEERKEVGHDVSPVIPPIGQTARGFDIFEFYDRNGIKCSLQKSSIATEDCIWLGCNDADPQQLVRGEGWKPISMPAEYNANTRMHLNQEQVMQILPMLQAFVDEGEITPIPKVAPVAPAASDPKRCAVCAWPLDQVPDGVGTKVGMAMCRVGNCSLRPLPERLYDRERVIRDKYMTEAYVNERYPIAPVAPAVAKEPREWRQKLISIALGRSRANFSHVPECARVMDWIWMDLDTPAVDAVLAEYAASLSPQSFDIVLHEREHFRDAYRRKLQEHKETLDLASQLQQRAEAAERSLSRLWIASQKYYSAFGGATEKVCQESREELGKLLTGTEPSDATLLAIDKQERSLETAREAVRHQVSALKNGGGTGHVIVALETAMKEEAVRELVRIEAWLRNEAEKLWNAAKSRRESQEMWRSTDLSDLDKSRGIAERMTGKKLPRISLAEARENGEREGRIARNYEKSATELVGFADTLAALRRVEDTQ
jgi:hypothetical protein